LYHLNLIEVNQLLRFKGLYPIWLPYAILDLIGNNLW